MAQGKPTDCEIVPTRDTGIFHLRVRHSPSPHDPPTTQFVHSHTAIAGCNCGILYQPKDRNGEIVVTLVAHYGLNSAPDGGKLVADMVLLDKTGSPASTVAERTSCPLWSGCRVACSLRLKVDDIEANCVLDNYFVVLCSVDVTWTPPAPSMEEEFPDLGHDLATMADEQDLTDVSFDVKGESFSAHRLVLATRSPVFKAELYGPMAESKLVSIVIQVMEASTFRSMLHYMYRGSLPNAGKTDASSTMADYQHLLVAADRYGIERLKKICEEKLCRGGIAIDTVVSMLELAEVHACLKLKAMCFDFLTDGENFKMVATSAEYLHLMQSFPSLLVEVRNRFKIAHDKPITTKPTAHKKFRLC